jgi:hypothetical protein
MINRVSEEVSASLFGVTLKIKDKNRNKLKITFIYLFIYLLAFLHFALL